MPRKLLPIATITAFILALGVQAASANRLSTSESRVRVVWSSLRLIASEVTVECPITLEGSFHSATIRKVVGALVGLVSRASVRGASGAGNCTSGTTTIFQESLPWHIQYGGFGGTLPRLSSVRLLVIGARLRVDPAGALPACNTTGTQANPGVGDILIEPNGLVTGLRTNESAVIPLESGFCPFGSESSYAGLATITRQGSTGNISVRLI